jgi:hypothetical protein
LGDARNFLEPLMRFARGDVWDLIVSHKSTKDLRIGATRLCSGRHAKKSAFTEFSVLFDFRLFQQYRRKAAICRNVDVS